MVLPKGRKLARRWLVEAYRLLSSGGTFYLAGANPEGIQSVIKDATEMFGMGAILAYHKGNRVARFRKDRNTRPFFPLWASEAWLPSPLSGPVRCKYAGGRLAHPQPAGGVLL